MTRTDKVGITLEYHGISRYQGLRWLSQQDITVDRLINGATAAIAACNKSCALVDVMHMTVDVLSDRDEVEAVVTVLARVYPGGTQRARLVEVSTSLDNGQHFWGTSTFVWGYDTTSIPTWYGQYDGQGNKRW